MPRRSLLRAGNVIHIKAGRTNEGATAGSAGPVCRSPFRGVAFGQDEATLLSPIPADPRRALEVSRGGLMGTYSEPLQGGRPGHVSITQRGRFDASRSRTYLVSV
jgi:hypothetical protein